jgi:MFS family permease
MNIILYSKTVLHITNTLTGVIMASAAVGIALGTAFSGKFLKGRDTKGFIIPALIGMIICLIGMVSVTHTFTSFLITIVAFAFLGGMFQVPSLTMIQQTDLGRNIGNVIAYLNTVTFIFILLSTVIFSSITYLTNESSLAVFFSMIFLCVIILFYFLLRHADFLQSSKSMIKSSITKNKI